MDPIVPPRLHAGAHLRVVAPAGSRAWVAEHDHTAVIEEKFAALGLRLSYGAHVDERDDFDSSPIRSRIDDLHAAFADPSVDAILTVIGGSNSNELLPYLDWDLIASHPKIFCGYSDITALQNAILARTGLVTYSGPHWSSFGVRDHFDRTLDWWVRALWSSEAVALEPSSTWSDDAWFVDQDERELLDNEGWWPLQPGRIGGRIVGGNLCTLNLLQGTGNLPDLRGAVLVLEDDERTNPVEVARDLTSLLQMPGGEAVGGLVVGRFQRVSGVTRDLLRQIVDRQPALAGKPVLANVDVGHTSPMATIPIGGRAELTVGPTSSLVVASR